MKKRIIPILVLLLLLLICGITAFSLPRAPFRNLSPENVASVTTSITSIQGTTEKLPLSADQQARLLDVLAPIRVYRGENPDWVPMTGGYCCEFFITLADGTEEYLILQSPKDFGHGDRNYRIPEEVCRQLESIALEAAYPETFRYQATDLSYPALRSPVSLALCRPYSDLKPKDVADIQLEDTTGESYTLTPKQRQALLSLLRSVRIPEEDLGAEEFYGRMLVFRVTKTDGTQLTVSAAPPQFRQYNAHFKLNDTAFKAPARYWDSLEELYNDIV